MTAKDLKNALLQEAVQGKLVPQIASEGNARDLLEEIRKESGESLPLASARKRSSATPSAGSNAARNARFAPITEDEIPFDIPENWCWCRLGEIFETTSGTTPQSKNPIYYNNGTIGWVRTTDLNNGILSFSEIKITEKAKTDCNLKMIPKNSVCIALYGGAGTIGKNAILNFETTINQSVCAMLPNTFADMRYLQYFLQWQRPYWMNYASGSRKDPNINQIIVKNCPFPLPPLTEQKRIVAAIEKFMPLIEEYGNKETELKAFNEQIGTLTKKAILQEAVQGKLVPQIASEGNAKDLLEEIKKEKAKLIKKGKLQKEKPLPEITEDEIPFDIPENWCWCRLGDLSTIVTKGTTPRGGNVAYSNEGIGFLRAENVAGIKDLDLSNLKYIDEETHTNFLKRSILNENDLLITIAGTLGRTAIVKKDNLPLNANQAISIVRLVNCDLIYLNYLVFSINSPELQKKLIGQTKVTAIPNLTLEIIENCLIPIPPLAEQKRIVAAIEKLLPLCEKLGEK